MIRYADIRPNPRPVTSNCACIDCDMVVYGTCDGHVKLTDLATDKTKLLGQHLNAVLSLAVTADSLVVSGKYLTAIFYQLRIKYLKESIHFNFDLGVKVSPTPPSLVCIMNEKFELLCANFDIEVKWSVEFL